MQRTPETGRNVPVSPLSERDGLQSNGHGAAIAVQQI